MRRKKDDIHAVRRVAKGIHRSPDPRVSAARGSNDGSPDENIVDVISTGGRSHTVDAGLDSLDPKTSSSRPYVDVGLARIEERPPPRQHSAQRGTAETSLPKLATTFGAGSLQHNDSTSAGKRRIYRKTVSENDSTVHSCRRSAWRTQQAATSAIPRQIRPPKHRACGRLCSCARRIGRLAGRLPTLRVTATVVDWSRACASLTPIQSTRIGKPVGGRQTTNRRRQRHT